MNAATASQTTSTASNSFGVVGVYARFTEAWCIEVYFRPAVDAHRLAVIDVCLRSDTKSISVTHSRGSLCF